MMRQCNIPETAEDADLSFKVFYELMKNRVNEILLVSSPYDAFIMEEDGRLAERIIHEYRGLNLTRPPRFTWVSSARKALSVLSEKKFDLVITMPRLDDMDPLVLGQKIKKQFQSLPVVLLSHDANLLFLGPEYANHKAIDRFFVWKGNTDLLLAIIKSVEDRMNVSHDTGRARVRVIILVEDSPKYRSSLLPLLYKEIVLQTQAVIGESINEEHRILRMRARPKILLAENFEEAESLYRQFNPYLLSVFADVRFMRNGRMDDHAGFTLLERIKAESRDMPLLVLSSEEANREQALKIPAVFLNKNSPSLHTDIRSFMVEYLGFGEFIFRLPDGKEVGRVGNLRAMEKALPLIPDESVSYHAKRNHFSTWLMARSEIHLASKLRPVNVDDFDNIQNLKAYLISCIRENRKLRQKGVITDFQRDDYDPDSDLVKIGKGSLGGKARGLAFVSKLLRENPEIQERYPDTTLSVPKTLVISTDGFDDFITENNLKGLCTSDCTDRAVTEMFLKGHIPEWLRKDLKVFLSQVTHPLAIRSSSLLEDAQYQPYAGVYKTYMIPNNHPDPSIRFSQLIRAITLVYASTYLEMPRSFSKSTLHRIEEEKMAVIIQQVIGNRHGGFFYPSISGVAQSYNFYPVSYMKPEEGIAYIALGFGKTVVEGGMALRFSPKYPQLLPQFSTVDDMLKNSQRSFFALRMTDFPDNFGGAGTTLTQLEITDVSESLRQHASVRGLFSTYLPQDHRVKDTIQAQGHLLLTFANILKYKTFPLSEILAEVLEMGRKGMGSPVEIEFAVRLPGEAAQGRNGATGCEPKPELALLQIRPMALHQSTINVKISEREINEAFCFATSAMGNGRFTDIADIVFVASGTFDPARTIEIAAEIGKLNQRLLQAHRRYLLIGPGRWGSADRFLGIPVNWNDISGVGAIIEASTGKLHADPSQGTHFFHNITSLGISYITITRNGKDFMDENWLMSLPARTQTAFVKHIQLDKPLTIKIDGKESCAIILK